MAYIRRFRYVFILMGLVATGIGLRWVATYRIARFLTEPISLKDGHLLALSINDIDYGNMASGSIEEKEFSVSLAESAINNKHIRGVEYGIRLKPETNLPQLCPYISMRKNEGNGAQKEAVGKLDKSPGHTKDTWIIGVAAPCFRGHCTPEWLSRIAAHTSANTSIPLATNQYTLASDRENDLFGCELSVEVRSVF